MRPEILTLLIPLPPLVAFGLIVLFTNRSNRLSHGLAIGAMLLSWGMAMAVFVTAITTPHLGEHPIALSFPWLPVGTTWLSLGVLIDPLGAATLFFVAWTCLAIFVYSVGYHNFGQPRDPKDRAGLPPHAGGIEPMCARFFAFISLFAFGMLTLVVSDNLLLLFVGWEIMGLCSYLLIGFWYGKDAAVKAMVKAFMTTRIGDVFMLLGLAWLYSYTGTLSFREILYNPVVLGSMSNTPAIPELASRLPALWPLLSSISVAGGISLLLFMGTIGKSAQFPLHVWLPDAMEGPTPVSAMIHAATMVSAGVYLALRFFPLLSAGWVEGGPLTTPMLVVSAVGAFTALFAATIAVAQNDIKRVLAYSTISQLGYMIAAVGIGAFVAAAFHLITHAFFKALLFLGSGSVIHGVEHGVAATSPGGAHAVPVQGGPAGLAATSPGGAHAVPGQGGPAGLAATSPGGAHAVPGQGGPAGVQKTNAHVDAQDMLNMGGLRSKMPATFWTFLIGGFALAGFPLITAGFWSKDEIFADAFANGRWVVFAMLALAALLTAFYTARQITLTFLGKPRTTAAEHAHESKWTMTLPLIVLAAFAVAAGWVGIPQDFPVVGGLLPNWFHGFVGGTLLEHPAAVAFSPIPLLTSITVSLLGLFCGWLVYRNVKAGAPDPLVKALGPVYTLLRRKYYFDEIYDRLIVQPAYWLAETFTYKFLDGKVIDGVLHTIAMVAGSVGTYLRRYIDLPVINGGADLLGESVKRAGRNGRVIQTGRVQGYLVVGVACVAVLLSYVLLVRP